MVLFQTFNPPVQETTSDDWYMTKDEVKVRNWRRYFDENSRRRFQEARRSVEIHFQLPEEEKVFIQIYAPAYEKNV